MYHNLDPSHPKKWIISLPYPYTNLDLVSHVGPINHGVIAIINSWAIVNWTSVLNWPSNEGNCLLLYFYVQVDQQGPVRLHVPRSQTEANQHKDIYVMIRHGKFSVIPPIMLMIYSSSSAPCLLLILLYLSSSPSALSCQLDFRTITHHTALMGRSPCCEKIGLKKGQWTPEEDQKLLAYIEEHGHGSWRSLPAKAGECG